MQFSYLHFEHPHILCTFVVEFFPPVYHPQDVQDEKVSSALAHWEHGKRNGIMKKSTESRRISDGFPTDFSSEFCQSNIPSGFRRNSVVIPSIPWIFRGIDGITTEPGFLFLYVPSVLGVT